MARFALWMRIVVALSSVEHAWPKRFIALHRAVRSAVLGSGRERAGTANAKGDDVKVFDLAANQAAIDFLEGLATPLIVESEESELREIGAGKPRYRLILDPVDGSDNWARNLPLSALSCAVIPIDAPLHADFVEAAVVGPLDQETPFIAQKGSGAWHGSVTLRTSDVRCIAEAMISVELNHFAPPVPVGRLMAHARGIRSYGCASRALVLVACGATDAHVDVRARLTPESYLAAARLVLEAGGCISDLDGTPLNVARGLTDRQCLIAAATPALRDAIVECLRNDGA